MNLASQSIDGREFGVSCALRWLLEFFSSYFFQCVFEFGGVSGERLNRTRSHARTHLRHCKIVHGVRVSNRHNIRQRLKTTTTMTTTTTTNNGRQTMGVKVMTKETLAAAHTLSLFYPPLGMDCLDVVWGNKRSVPFRWLI